LAVDKKLTSQVKEMDLRLCSQEQASVPAKALPNKAAAQAHVVSSSLEDHIASSTLKMGNEKASVVYQFDFASTLRFVYLNTHKFLAL
jgi:hypothetical protein